MSLKKITAAVWLACLVTAFQMQSTVSKKFIWSVSNDLDERQNWIDGNLPCADSAIETDKNSITVAMIENGLSSKEFFLPDDAVLYFDKYTILGIPGEWQCPQSTPQKQMSFTKSQTPFNVFDSRNWMLETEYTGEMARTRLHVDRVPSQVDEVVFPSNVASRISIDAPLIVGRANWTGQYLTNSEIVLTMEGQLIFDIGPELKTRFVIDNVDYQLPNTDVIQIMNGPVESKKGVRSNNVDQPQFGSLCGFIECIPPKCGDPVQPTGHCCPVCGAVITFHHARLDLEQAQKMVPVLEEQHFPINSRLFGAGLSISRMDQAATIPGYQIVAITDESESYDEDAFLAAARSVYSIVDGLTFMDDAEHGTYSYDYKEQVSTQRGLIRIRYIFEYLFLIAVVAGVCSAYFVYLYKTNARFRLWWHSSSHDFSGRMTVAWQTASKFAEDQVNIVFRLPPATSSAGEEGVVHQLMDPTGAGARPAGPEDKEDVFEQKFVNPSFDASSSAEDVSVVEDKTPSKAIKREVKEEHFIDLDF